MRFTIVAVGDRLPDWADAATAEYLKRMPREARVELKQVVPHGARRAATLGRR